MTLESYTQLERVESYTQLERVERLLYLGQFQSALTLCLSYGEAQPTNEPWLQLTTRLLQRLPRGFLKDRNKTVVRLQTLLERLKQFYTMPASPIEAVDDLAFSMYVPIKRDLFYLY